jgi:Dullard-like phosphatase family protein
VTKVQPSD